MAKIALMVGIGILGAVTGGIAAAGLLGFAGTFAGGVVSAGIISGASIGMGIGSLLGAAIFPGHSSFNGPQLNDLQASSSANGAGRPFGYGGFRIGAQIIWSSGLKETKTSTKQSAKGGPSVTSNTFTYTVSFAAAFCEGPANIVRIWGDSKLIYDTTGKGGVSSDVLDTGINNGSIIGTTTVVPTLYTGSSTQLPNPIIQAAQGIAVTPAFRGTCYLVYEEFPLADFGNRLPNIRGEIATSTTLAYNKDTYKGNGTSNSAFFVALDRLNRKGYAIGYDFRTIQQVDLSTDSTIPLAAYALNTVYAVGDEVLDSNGNVEVVVAVTGDAKSGTVTPVWLNTDVYTLVDHHVTWRNIGVGPEAIAITGSGYLQPTVFGSETFSGWVNNSMNNVDVDPSGYLWAFYSTSTGRYAAKYDPNSFSFISRTKLPGTPTAISFHRRSDGDFAYIVGVDPSSGSNFFIVVNTSSMSIVGNVLAEPITAPGGSSFPFQYGYPSIDAKGVAYVVLHDFTTFSWWIVIIDPSSGMSRRELSFTGNSTIGKGETCIVDTTDNTLIVFTTNAAMLKVDPLTGNVLVTTAAGLYSTAANLATSPNAELQYCKQNNGQVAPDGMVRVFTSGVALNTYDAATLTLQSSIPISNWFPNTSGPGGVQGVTDSSYDSATGSMLLTPFNSGNYIGQTYRIYLNRQSTAGEALSDVVTDILERTGMPSGDIDVSLITSTVVLGYPITRNSDAKSLLAPLAASYFFDLVETDFKLRAIPRGGSSVISIPESDLGLSSDGSKMTETIMQENDLPRAVTIIYSDSALDYQQGQQLKHRHSRVKKTKNQTLITLPLTLQQDVAAQIADKALHTFWAESKLYDFKLWKSTYLKLDPTDVVTFTYNNLPFTARLAKTTTGNNLTMEISGVSEDSRNYISTVTGTNSDGFIPTGINPIGATLLFLMDLPLLQDLDASGSGNSGFYWAMVAPGLGWPGAVLNTSSDNSVYDPVASSVDEVSYGTVVQALPAPLRSTQTWDNVNTITVFMSKGTLSTTTQLNVLNGANAIILGSEVIQFTTATLNVDGSYTLSGLLRGRRGTEWAATLHTTAETLIVLGSGIHRNSLSTSLLGMDRYYKAVTIGQTIDSARASQLAIAGNDLKPYSPCQLTGAFDGSGNLTMNWVRRTRLGGAWLNGTGTVPLAEDTENYDVDIMLFDGGGVDIMPYTVSPSSVGVVQMTGWVVGLSEVFVPNLTVNPFTITWEDGVTASYLGHTFGGASAGVPQPGNLIVHDPNRTGDANGGSVTYSMETPSTPHFSNANTSGYFYLGLIPALSGGSSLGKSLPTGQAGSEITARTVKGLYSPTYLYSDALQLADLGYHASTFPGYVRAKVYQNSAQVGRGFPVTAWPGSNSLGESGSSDASSINGVPVSSTPPTDGQVLTYVAADSQAEWQTPSGAARTDFNYTTGSLATNATETGTLSVGYKSFMLLGASATKQCRIQLYSTAALRDADAGRAIGTNPTAGAMSGVLLDLVLSPTETWPSMTPPVLVSNTESSPTDVIAYRITNLDTTAAVPITLTILPLET